MTAGAGSVVTGVWFQSGQAKPNEPWGCPRCPGDMEWFSSELREHGTKIEHKFACTQCLNVEHITFPFTGTADTSPQVA